MRRLVLPVVLFLGLGCASSQGITHGVTYGIDEPRKMSAAILTNVPVGTSVGDARAFMEREGFECRLVQNGSFGDRTGLDYLSCSCDRREGLLVTRHWHIALVCRDGKITEVLAKTALTGL
jgi:hypothetical protein